MRKLTKAEIFYIQTNPENLSQLALAEDMDINVSTVKKYFKEKKETQKKEETLFVKSVARKRGSVVLTPASSELADKSPKKSVGLSGAIHRPKD